MRITARSLTNYQVEILAGSHTFVSDEPIGVGDDAGPSPFDLLLASLASCTIITLQMYARRKNWPLETITFTAELRREDIIHADGSKTNGSIIDTHLTFSGGLNDEQIKRLEEIANRCPVHRTLTSEIQILSNASRVDVVLPPEEE
jgi:putative redox protein